MIDVNKIPKRVDIIGVPISVVNMNIMTNFIENNLHEIKGEYICASNAHTTVMAHEDKNYLKVQTDSIISMPDGKPLSIIGRKKGYKEMDKTTGTNFMENMFTNKKLKNCKHYFYGNSKENLEKMIENIKINYPELHICGYEPSIFRELSETEINELADRINKSEADFVWVGIGAPRQEILMNRMRKKTNSIMVGVGGAFNIFAGVVNNAPKFIQKIGMEWFYRLIKEPRRLFKRYLVTNSKFIWYNWRTK